MAKGKYQEWLTPDGLLLLEGWAREGLTDEQIAKNVGIRFQTLYEWEKRFPEIREAIKKGKGPVDFEVENALLKRALGYDYEETSKEIIQMPGGKTKTTVKTITRHVAGDVTAQIYWLKNRKRSTWCDKPIQRPADNIDDDGFLEALSGTAAEDWADDES